MPHHDPPNFLACRTPPPLALQATTASPKATVVITVCSSWADRRRPWYFCKNGSKREGLGVRNVQQQSAAARAGKARRHITHARNRAGFSSSPVPHAEQAAGQRAVGEQEAGEGQRKGGLHGERISGAAVGRRAGGEALRGR